MKIFLKIKELFIRFKIKALCKKCGAKYVMELRTGDESRAWCVQRSDGLGYMVSREHYYGNQYHWSIWSEVYPDELGKDWCHKFFQRCIWAGILDLAA